MDAKGLEPSDHEHAVVTRGDGAEFVHTETGCYYGGHRDHDKRLRTVSTGCKDKENARQFLADLEKKTTRVEVGVVSRDEVRRVEASKGVKIDKHVGDYLRTFTGSKSDRRDVGSCLNRLKTDLKWGELADLRRDGLEIWLADQFNAGRSARSCNAYRLAAARFGNWLVEVKRVESNPLRGLPEFNEEADCRRPRRALTPDELPGSSNPPGTHPAAGSQD